MSYLVGIDIGGTFTDCALGAGAEALGISLDRFCRDIDFLSHGTTVGTNTIIQKRGAKVGLITTKGHENRVKAMVQRLAPKVFVSTSVDIAPKWGEYERVTATALNAYLGPVMGGYLGRLDSSLRELGYGHGLQITQCCGGTVPVAHAGEAPLLTLDSGPVSGVTASMFLGAAMGAKNVITTDMGGTSFDVSIIYQGKPAYSFISNTDQYEYFLPKVDLQAIGAGGGSLVRVQPEKRTMTVGPDSAGAFPGPVCYGRGGTVPTVTDAELVLGYLDPDNFAGGRMRLDRD